MKEYNFCPICGASLDRRVIEGRERKYCPKCSFIDFKNPLPVVVAVAARGREFLLIKRKRPPRLGRWAFPAGYIELGEKPEEACLRELFEETGMSGETVKLLELFRREVKENLEEVLIAIYLVRVTGGNLKPGGDVDGARFFKAKEVQDCYLDDYEYYKEHYKKIVEKIKKRGIL